MTAPHTEPIGTVEDSGSWSEEFSLRRTLIAVRRRWWAVVLVFLVVLAVGIWRTLNEPRLYRATSTVRIQQVQAPVAGAAPTPTYFDYRIDRLASERQVIASANVAERVVQRLGLRLQIALPADLRRGQLFGATPPVVDSAIPSADFQLRLADARYSLRGRGIDYGSAAYGDTLRGPGFMFVVPAPLGNGIGEVILHVGSWRSAIDLVRGGLSSAPVENTDIIAISYLGTDPVLTAQIANEVARAYADFSREALKEQAARKSAFIGEKVREQEARLSAAQDRLKEFRERNKLTDVTAEQLALQERIQNLEGERKQAQLEQDIYSSLIGKLSAADTTDEELRRLVGTQAVARNSSVNELYSRWFDLIRERQILVSQGFTPRYRDIKAIDSLIARTKQDLQVASSVYLQSLESRLESYDRNLAELRQQTTQFPGLAADQARLMADVATLQRIYEDLQSQYQLARIAESVDTDVVRLLDLATIPYIPVSPNRRRAAMLAAVLGLVLGIGAAVLLDRLDDSVRSPEEIQEQMGVPVLGLIPAIKLDGDGAGGGRRSLERLVTHADPRSTVAEAFRSLRTNLAFARAHQDVRTIVLTSPGPADGKSTTVANLAITFAQQGQKTLLIDADLRRAVLDKTFEIPRSPGLTDVVIGSTPLTQAVSQTQVPNLFVLGSGQFPPNPSELLGSAAMRRVLQEASEQFDVVLLDSPPLLAVTDAAVLTTLVDGAILVVRAEETARPAVRRALGQLHTVHGRVLGAVMNDVNFKDGAYYGGYGYYYYSYYGADALGNGKSSTVLQRLGRLASRATSGRKQT